MWFRPLLNLSSSTGLTKCQKVLFSTRYHGVVKFFRPDRGYGFIISPTGEEIFVQRDYIKEGGYRTLWSKFYDQK
jgi:hypothetical protein